MGENVGITNFAKAEIETNRIVSFGCLSSGIRAGTLSSEIFLSKISLYGLLLNRVRFSFLSIDNNI